MATASLGFENFFETTLSSGVNDTVTTIPLTNVPTPSEGFLVIDPDTPASREVIYYTSKGGSDVTVPSGSGNGRGYDGSTATSHSSGTKVIMAPIAAMFEALQDGTGLASGAITVAKRTGGFKVGTFTPNSSTGNQSITGVGFTPKLVEFRELPSGIGTIAEGAYGVMDENGNEFATWWNDNDSTPTRS